MAVDLSSFSIFEHFPKDVLDKIAALGEPVSAEPGAVLIEQGQVGREAFVLLAGEAQIVVNGEPVATTGPGSLLGEMALVDLRPRSATVVVTEDADLLSYDAKSFREILDAMPDEDRQRLGEQNETWRLRNRDAGKDERPRPIGR